MIAFIKGEIIELKPNYAVILTASGVGYLVFVSIQVSSTLKLKDQISLRITQIIKEDSHRLFGFLDSAEQKCFEELIKVNGVGAVSAMAILSAFSPAQLASAIDHADINAIKKAPGVGPKTAQRLILELKGKLDSSPIAAVSKLSALSEQDEALAALMALGFKQDAAAKALKTASGNSASELVKSALKIIK